MSFVFSAQFPTPYSNPVTEQKEETPTCQEGYTYTSETKDGVTFYFCAPVVPVQTQYIQQTSFEDTEKPTIHQANGKNCPEATCYKSERCYPYFYVKDGEYCSDEKGRFILLLKIGEECAENLECETSLCDKGKCVNSSETGLTGLIDYLNKRINELEERINFLEQQLDYKTNNSIEENVSVSITGGVVSENSVERKGFFDWLKNLFS